MERESTLTTSYMMGTAAATDKTQRVREREGGKETEEEREG